MKIWAYLLLMLMPMGCSRSPSTPAITSPSGKYSVRAEISGDEAEPTRRLCARLVFVDTATQKEMRLQTAASDVQKWAIGWSPQDALVLYSSDIGIHAYEIVDGKVVERLARADETAIGLDAYQKRYGRRPANLDTNGLSMPHGSPASQR